MLQVGKVDVERAQQKLLLGLALGRSGLAGVGERQAVQAEHQFVGEARVVQEQVLVVQQHQQKRGGQHVDAAFQVRHLVVGQPTELAQHTAALGHALGVAQLVEDVVVVDHGTQDRHGGVELALGQERLGVAEHHVDVEVGERSRLGVDQLVRVHQRHGVVALAVGRGLVKLQLGVDLPGQVEQQPAVVLDRVARRPEHIVLGDGLDCGVLVGPAQLERDVLPGVRVVVHEVQGAHAHQEPSEIGAGGDVGHGAPSSDRTHVLWCEREAARGVDPHGRPRTRDTGKHVSVAVQVALVR